MLADLKDLTLEFWLRNRNSGNLVWKTKEGKIIPIKDLSDEHLANIMKMLSQLTIEDYDDCSIEDYDDCSIGDLEDALG